MDIGDVSEIPTTRKKLPSMQELGAFDFEAPAQDRSRSATAPEPATALGTSAGPAAAAVPTPNPARMPQLQAAEEAPSTAPAPPAAPPRPRVTSEQLREALAKADPGTRSKLLRLMAGGRTVQQSSAQRNQPGPRPPPLSMVLDRPLHTTPPPAQAAAGSRRTAAQTGTSRRSEPTRASRPAAADEPLLQIDRNTELLDAAPPPVSAEQKKAALLAQLAAARSDEPAQPPPTTAAHKVLFPAYDPLQHGDSVHRPGRRGDGPVEGHFPAPRQPLRANYRHADGRPMDEEESRVEQVLQEQRCEQTLQVLARDGVNGLLLSPRDLDAAVEDGVLDAETADLLWKTWSALRPVIHVIEDAPAPADAAAEPGAADPGEAPAIEPGPAALPAPAPALPETALPSGSAEGSRSDGSSTRPVTASRPVGANPAAAAPAPAEPPVDEGLVVARTASSAPPPHTTAPSESARSARSPLREESRPLADRPGQVRDASAEAPSATPAPGRWRRIVGWLRRLGRAFVVASVLSSCAQLALWAWHYGGHWLLP